MTKTSVCLTIASILLAACGPDVVIPGGSAGSTTAVSGTASETGTASESGSESETGDEEQDMCGGWSLAVDLSGSMSMPGDCQDFVFTGETFEQISPGIWALDSCPCNADCEEADPHTFALIFYGEGAPEFPTMPACPQIQLNRDQNCDIESVVVRDLADGNSPVWWAAAHNSSAIMDFLWFKYQLFGEQLCSDGDDDGATVIGHGIRYFADDETPVELYPGESAVLANTPLGPIEVHNGNASSMIGEDVMEPLSYMAVVQP